MEKERKIDRNTLLALLLLATIVRGYAAFNSQTIAIDGLVYLKQARMIQEGDIKEALSVPFPPGYPALVAATASALGLPRTPEGWELAGALASLLCGVLLVLVVYLLAYEVAGYENGRLVALVAALVCAVHPQLVRYTTQVRSEGMYFLLFALSLYFLVRALKRGGCLHAFLTALSSVGAYLVRPEGMLVSGVFIVAVLVRRGFTLKRRGLLTACSLAVFLCAAAPYLFFIYRVEGIHRPAGRFKLTLKRQPLKIVERKVLQRDYVRKDGRVGEVQRIDWGGFGEFAKGFSLSVVKALPLALSRVLHPVVALLLILWGLLKRKKRREEWLLLSIAILYYLLMCFFDVRHRHFTQVIVPVLPLAALGAIEVSHRLGRLPLFARRRSKIFLALFLFFSLLAPVLKPRHIEQAAEKEAGIWLRNNGTPYPRLLCRVKRVAFYADGEHIGDAQFPVGRNMRLRMKDIEKALKDERCDYVVVDASPLTEDEKAFLDTADHLHLLRRFTHPPLSLDAQEIEVYEVVQRR